MGENIIGIDEYGIGIREFYGGTERGRCVQFDMSNRYCQMPHAKAIEFLERALELLKNEKIQADECCKLKKYLDANIIAKCKSIKDIHIKRFACWGVIIVSCIVCSKYMGKSLVCNEERLKYAKMIETENQ